MHWGRKSRGISKDNRLFSCGLTTDRYQPWNKNLTVIRIAMCKEQIITVIQTEAIQILRSVNGPGEPALNHPVRNSPAYISQHRLQREMRTTSLI